MYRPPMSSSSMRLEASRRAPEREHDVQRRLHREHVAAERAKMREQRATSQSGGRRLARPAAALWSLVAIRR
jgi:hypothetical protein